MMKDDQYYLSYATYLADYSQDPVTKVGACIVKDGKILSGGQNTVLDAFDINEIPQTYSEDILQSKNTFMCHAEINAILNYKGLLYDLDGATLYVNISPCYECAKLLAQLGIKRIVYHEEYHREQIWSASKIILDKCKIKYEKL